MGKIIGEIFLYLFALVAVSVCMPIMVLCIIVAPRAGAKGLAGFSNEFVKALKETTNDK